MSKQIAQTKYVKMLEQIISEIKSVHIVTARRINTAMLQMYWNIGKRLSVEDIEKGYGGRVVEQLSIDFKNEFPDLSGFSPRNLWYMKKFYDFYRNANQKLQLKVAVLPWKHHLLIIDKVKTIEEASFYISNAVEQGWTHDILLNFIKSNAYKNSKLLPKSHNFKNALPQNLQEQATEILKSRYNLSLLNIHTPIKELQLEKKIVEKVKLFMLELGKGFSFIGNQHRLTLNNEDFFVDLLFFNRIIKSLIAIDLKIGSFKPEHAGKMNFYLGLLDDQLRLKGENPSIGIILCADKDKVKVEIALRDINKPIGVAQYDLFPIKEIKALINRELKK
jgi:predicted nuclease of restriction endonuclease-like (RecB) superfamily